MKRFLPEAALPQLAPKPAAQPRPRRSFAREPSPVSPLGRLLQGAEEHHQGHEQTYPWWRVLWLTGVDYFSTLGYQPGIAFLAAGILSPIASAFLVVVTLAGALPTYMEVAKRSHIGQGSLAMLEHLLSGWKAKVLVLVLLGFASTDFVITMTLSAADAAQHAVENPLLHPLLDGHKMAVTLGLLALLAGVFLRGFREAIGMAVLAGIPYILLNLVVLLRGGWELIVRPEQLQQLSLSLAAQGSWPTLLIGAGLIFPKLALGMSGFETGVSVMPLIDHEAGPDAPEEARVRGRVRATRLLLATAAVAMSLLLLGSSVTTTALIPASEFAAGGKANGRALAYLAHGLLGSGFGTVYDFATILILWFAGASAMAGLMSLIPRYLPRFGMAPAWVAHSRPLILILFAVDVVVTLVFKADVDAQGGAYATGVLVLILSAALAVALASWREARAGQRRPWASLYFWAVTLVFGYTLADNVVERPDGVIISAIFCGLVLTTSGLSRFWRATELRVEKLEFADPESQRHFESMKDKKVNLVPLRTPGADARLAKTKEIRTYYNAHGPLAFLCIELHDDRSEFATALKVKVEREDKELGGNYLITVTGAVAVANTIAYLSEQLDPIALFLGLTLENKMSQAMKYLIFGEGEVGILVYEILVRYWEQTPEEDVRPLIFLMSE